MQKIIVDTNIFLRLLLDDVHEQHLEAKKFFAKARNHKVEAFIPSIIIFEINFALEKYYLLSKGIIIKSLTSIISAKYLKVENREVFKSAISIFEKSNISLTDAFLIAKAKSENLEIFTFDKKLLKQF